eukprot:6031002-Alexandrium_andersonii.AAC.1
MPLWAGQSTYSCGSRRWRARTLRARCAHCRSRPAGGAWWGPLWPPSWGPFLNPASRPRSPP